MQNRYSENDLNADILALEAKQEQEAILLKSEFRRTVDALRPINLIKDTLDDVATATELKGNFLTTAIGLGAGILSKKAFIGFSHNPLKKLVGTGLMLGVTSMMAQNPVAVKMATIGVVKLLKRLKFRKETV